MINSEILEVVISIAAEESGEPREQMTAGTRLDDLFDSLEKLEFALVLEASSGSGLPMNGLDQFETLGDVAAYLT